MLTFKGSAIMLEKSMRWPFYDYKKKKKIAKLSDECGT